MAQLYQRAGVDLHADLNLLTRTANVTADPAAHRWMRRTSTLTGRLTMPVLTLHTTHDDLVPVQHEEEYADDVRDGGSAALLRQAYADHPGHCTFTTAELVAAVITVGKRIETGAGADWPIRTGCRAAPTRSGSARPHSSDSAHPSSSAIAAADRPDPVPPPR